MSFEALFVLGAVVLVTGFLATVFFYVSLRQSPSQEATPSFIRYFFFAGLLCLLAYIAGTAVGIYGACRSENSGNLCGIWGALGVGPLSAGVALWSYGFLWRRRLAQ
jgi:uncharacterized membrane protein